MKKILAFLFFLIVRPVFAAPVISNILVTATTGTTATIQWTTNTPSSSQLLFGTDSTLPFSNNVVTAAVTTHTMQLTLLQAGPTYYVAPVSKDNTGFTQGSTITFALCGAPTTSVSGTATNYYEYGRYTMTWMPPAGDAAGPTVCGQSFPTTVSGSLDGSASFNNAVADALKVVPGPGQWQVLVTDAGNIAPVTINETISGASTNVSTGLQAAATASGLAACITNTNTLQVYPGSCGGGGGGGGGVVSLNGLQGNVTLVPGANVTITPSGGSITIGATGGGGGSGPLGTLQSDIPVNNSTNTGAIDTYQFVAGATTPGTGLFTAQQAVTAANSHGGSVVLQPSAGRVPFTNTGNVRVLDQRTDVPATARSVTEFGAACDLRSIYGTFTASLKAFTVNSGSLSSNDIGKTLVAVGAVGGTPVAFESILASVTDSTHGVVTTAFPFTQSTNLQMDLGHDDTAAITQAMSAAGSGGTLVFPEGNCWTHAQTIRGQSPTGLGFNSLIVGFPGEDIFAAPDPSQGSGTNQGAAHIHDLTFSVDARIDATKPWQLVNDSGTSVKSALYRPIAQRTGVSSNPVAPGWMQGAGPNFSGAINGVGSVTAASLLMTVPANIPLPVASNVIVFPYLPSVFTTTVSSVNTGTRVVTLSTVMPTGSTNGQAEWFAGTSVQKLSTLIGSGSCPSTITLSNSVLPVAGYESNVAPFGLIQIDGEQFFYLGRSDALVPTPANTLYNIQCAQNGTTRAAHSVSATVVPLNNYQPTYPWPVTPTINTSDTTPAATAGYFPGWNVGNAAFAFPLTTGISTGSATGAWTANAKIENLSFFPWPNEIVNTVNWGEVNHTAMMYAAYPSYATSFENLFTLFLFYGVAFGGPSIENGNWATAQPTADGSHWNGVQIWAANPINIPYGNENTFSNFNVYSQEGSVANVGLGANTCMYFTALWNDQTGGIASGLSLDQFNNLYCEPESGDHAGIMPHWEFDTFNSQFQDLHMGGGGEVYIGGSQQHFMAGDFNQQTTFPLVNWGTGTTSDYTTIIGEEPKSNVYGVGSLINYGSESNFQGTTDSAFGTPSGPYGGLQAVGGREPIPSQTMETFNTGNLTAPYTSSGGGMIYPDEFNLSSAFETHPMNAYAYDVNSPVTGAYVGCNVGTTPSTFYCNPFKFNGNQISIGPGQRLAAGKYVMYLSAKDLTVGSNSFNFVVSSTCSLPTVTSTVPITNAWPTSAAGYFSTVVDFTGATTGCGVAFGVGGATSADQIQIGFVAFSPLAENLKAQSLIITGLTPGTSPVCPNGTGGALTTAGCSGGGGGGGAAFPGTNGIVFNTSMTASRNATSSDITTLLGYTPANTVSPTFTGIVTTPSLIVSGLTPGTSPVCPNGGSGALTTSGCTSASGGVPGGSAGGGLTGTYPNPGLNASSVVTAVSGQALTPSLVNNYVEAAGVNGAGIGVAQSAWSSPTAYPQCRAVSNGGNNYIAVAPSTGVTPGTNSAIWWQVPNNRTPTNGDCAFYIAASKVSGTLGAQLVLPPGSTSTCIGFMEPTVTSPGNPVVAIYGAGKQASILSQSCSSSNAVITQPDSGVAFAFAGLDFDGFTVDANFNAPADINVYGAQQFKLSHLRLINPADGSDHYIEFGHPSSANHNFAWTYEPTLEDIDTLNSHGPGSGAAFTVAVSGGVPTITVGTGGSSYVSAYSQLILSGSGAFADVPCTSRGTDTITVASGVITAVTTTATGCTGPLQATVFGGNQVTYCFKFNDTSDSKGIIGLTPSECNTGVFNSNAVSQMSFTKTHPIATMVGILDQGNNNYLASQIDSVYRYGFDLQGATNTNSIRDTDFEYSIYLPGASDYHFLHTSGSPTTAPFAVYINSDICGNAPSFGGYYHFITPSGGGNAFLPQFVHATDSVSCDSHGAANLPNYQGNWSSSGSITANGNLYGWNGIADLVSVNQAKLAYQFNDVTALGEALSNGQWLFDDVTGDTDVVWQSGHSLRFGIASSLTAAYFDSSGVFHSGTQNLTGGLTVAGTTALNGTSTALTPTTGDNTTKIATTAFVQAAVLPAIIGQVIAPSAVNVGSGAAGSYFINIFDQNGSGNNSSLSMNGGALSIINTHGSFGSYIFTADQAAHAVNLQEAASPFLASQLWYRGASTDSTGLWIKSPLGTNIQLGDTGGVYALNIKNSSGANAVTASSFGDVVAASTILGKHVGSNSASPTIAAGPAAGTSPTVALVGANDQAGYITLTTGSSPAASDTVATVTFNTAWGAAPKCFVWPANAATQVLTGGSAAQVFGPFVSTTAFPITQGSGALAATTAYEWGYQCLP